MNTNQKQQRARLHKQGLDLEARLIEVARTNNQKLCELGSGEEYTRTYLETRKDLNTLCESLPAHEYQDLLDHTWNLGRRVLAKQGTHLLHTPYGGFHNWYKHSGAGKENLWLCSKPEIMGWSYQPVLGARWNCEANQHARLCLRVRLTPLHHNAEVRTANIPLSWLFMSDREYATVVRESVRREQTLTEEWNYTHRKVIRQQLSDQLRHLDKVERKYSQQEDQR